MLQKAARPLGETQQQRRQGTRACVSATCREAMQEADFLLPPAFPSQPWEPSNMSARREKHDKDNHDNDDTGLQQQRRRQRNVIQKFRNFPDCVPCSFLDNWIATTAQTTKKRNSEAFRTTFVCAIAATSTKSRRRTTTTTTSLDCNNSADGKQRNSEKDCALLGPTRPAAAAGHVPSWTNDDKEPSKDNHYNDVTGLQQQRRRQRNVIQRRTGFFVMCFLGAPALRDKSDGLQQTRWIKCYSERGFATVKTDLGLRTIWKTAMA